MTGVGFTLLLKYIEVLQWLRALPDRPLFAYQFPIKLVNNVPIQYLAQQSTGV